MCSPVDGQHGGDAALGHGAPGGNHMVPRGPQPHEEPLTRPGELLSSASAATQDHQQVKYSRHKLLGYFVSQHEIIDVLPINKEWAGKDWRQKEKGTAEDEMVRWHHWFAGYESEGTPGDSEGQGSLVCYSPWGHKELDGHDLATEQQQRNMQKNTYLHSWQFT